eukprot:2700858-Rhodomonas_salina.1
MVHVIVLSACFAGRTPRYRAVHSLRAVRYSHTLCCYQASPTTTGHGQLPYQPALISLRACYAMSGPDLYQDTA